MLVGVRNCFAFIWLCLCSVVVAAEDVIELYAVDYPPYMIVSDVNNISGIDVDVTREAFAAVGITAKINTAPWKRVLKNLEHGRVLGALSCSKRPDRVSFMLFSDQVSEANQVAVMSKGLDDRKLVNFQDLSNFKVIAVEGWGIQRELVRKNIPHTTTAEMDNGIKSVVYRDIDVFYSGELTTLYRAGQLGIQDDIKIKRFTDKESSSFHLCLSKGYPDSQRLLQLFNTGLAKIKASGRFDAIYEQYL